MSDDLLTFFNKFDKFGCKTRESYGQTESRGLLSNGYPSPGIRIVLIPLPEMGYTLEDKPNPRGEIAVKSSKTTPISDWICDEVQLDAIKQRYTEDGFFLTGDIAEQLADGSYKIIDRVSSLQKLANGIYISPERIENVISLQPMHFKSSISPSACFITLNKSRTATIVMFRLEKPIEDRINLEKELLLQVQSVCRNNDIPEREIPSKVIIDDVADGGWSQENGILTVSSKVNRRALDERLQRTLAEQSNSIVSSLSSDYPQSSRELALWLSRKLQSEINAFDECMLTSTFSNLGFDSAQLTLMAATLPALLDELAKHGVNINKHNEVFSAPTLMHHSMMSLAEMLWENPKQSLARRPLGERLLAVENHSMARLSQLKANRLNSSMAHKPPKISANKVSVLVTGCAGFLGADIVRDLLNSDWVSEVICLVRDSKNEDAASRVRRIVLTGYESLNQVYTKKITVINSDLSQDKFGLQESEYEELIHRKIGLIIHAAAMIKSWNLADGLNELIEPNVNGTLRIAQLAFELSQYRGNQLTPIVYVSTNSVICQEVYSQDHVRIVPEAGWFSRFKNEAEIKKNFNAYSATKFMAEQILRESGLPLSIVRAPLLTWNTKTGDGNSDDWLNRLLDDCILCKAIPQFASDVSVNAMPVNQCSELIVKSAKGLIKNSRNNPFSVEYPHQGVPGLRLCRVFEKLKEQAQANGVTMDVIPEEVWANRIKQLSPTRFSPLLTTLPSIKNRRSETTPKLSKMEGITLWLQVLLAAHSKIVPANSYQKGVHQGFFKLNTTQGAESTVEQEKTAKGVRKFFCGLI